MAVQFRSDLASPAIALPHFWEHTVGSGHATLALRADWQAHLQRTHREIGMRHVRFHRILSDDVGTLIGQSDQLIYSLFNIDRIFDFLISIGMRPFVELSFIPSILSSGGKTVFHYRANVTAPRDLAQWSTLIRKLAAHCVERYGIQEVRQWFFEVWNEPNLTAFGSADQAQYLELYRYTAEALKTVDSGLKVGGPATADNAWIKEFVNFCTIHDLPIDFVSTHHYPTDAFGQPGDDTEAQLSKSARSILRPEAREVGRQAGRLPVYYTEWCTSSNPRDPMHDDPYAAAFIVKTVLEANGAGRSAYSITPDTTAGMGTWSDQDLIEYLSKGHAQGRGMASGPMGEVVDESLSHLTVIDLAAIVTYLRTVPVVRSPDLPAPTLQLAPEFFADDQSANPHGRAVYEGACAGCHGWSGASPNLPKATLTGTRAINDPSGGNVAQVILRGGQRHVSDDSVDMPNFGATYSDFEIASVANFVTERFGAKRSTLAPKDIAKLRNAE